MADKFERSFWFYKADFHVKRKPSCKLSLRDAFTELGNKMQNRTICRCDFFSPREVNASYTHRYSGCLIDLYIDNNKDIVVILVGVIDRENDQAVGDQRYFSIRDAAAHADEYTAEAVHVLMDLSNRSDGNLVIVEKGNIISPSVVFSTIKRILNDYLDIKDNNGIRVESQFDTCKFIDSSLKDELNGATLEYFAFKRKPIDDELMDSDIVPAAESKLIFNIKEKKSLSWITDILKSQTAKKYDKYTLRYCNSFGKSRTVSSDITDKVDIMSDLIQRREVIHFGNALPAVCNSIHIEIRDRMIQEAEKYS